MFNKINKVSFSDNGWHDVFPARVIGWVYPPATTRYIKYKYIDPNLVYVVFRIDGTSNSTLTSFSLPFGFESQTTNLMTAGGFRVPISINNNNTTNIGQLLITRDQVTGTVFCRGTRDSNNAWTASGVKSMRGAFFLPVAS
jgi:hypothetical protein